MYNANILFRHLGWLLNTDVIYSYYRQMSAVTSKPINCSKRCSHSNLLLKGAIRRVTASTDLSSQKAQRPNMLTVEVTQIGQRWDGNASRDSLKTNRITETPHKEKWVFTFVFGSAVPLNTALFWVFTEKPQQKSHRGTSPISKQNIKNTNSLSLSRCLSLSLGIGAEVSQGEYNISSEESGKGLFTVTSFHSVTAAKSSRVVCLASVSALTTPLNRSVRLIVGERTQPVH